ncbi:hypothetical protein QEN19_001241 [Hanseniaspora menglaensis]
MKNLPLLSTTSLNFYKFDVTRQVFFQTEHTFSIVNLKPITTHHILVIPKRSCKKLFELNQEEVADFYSTIHLLYRFIRHLTNTNGVNLAIQDGELSGQSVPHVHAHIIPRFENGNMGDKVYDLLKGNDQAKNSAGDVAKPDAPIQRRERSMEEMISEASHLKDMVNEWLKLSEEEKDKQSKDIPDYSEKDTEI